MKIAVCDVCYYQDEKTTEAKWNLTRGNGMEKIRVQACDEHHHWTKQFKDFALLRKAVNELPLCLHKFKKAVVA